MKSPIQNCWRSCSYKSQFSFIHESIAEMALWHLDLLICVREFLYMRHKYRRRTLALIISGDIEGAGGLLFIDFDLKGGW